VAYPIAGPIWVLGEEGRLHLHLEIPVPVEGTIRRLGREEESHRYSQQQVALAYHLKLSAMPPLHRTCLHENCGAGTRIKDQGLLCQH
jgi:hypothetical protein